MQKSFHSSRFRLLVLGILALALAWPLPAAAALEEGDEIVVIVHEDNDVDSLSVAEVRDIFLKRDTTWDDGDAIIVHQYSAGNDLREVFTEEVLDMSSAEENRYWVNERVRRGLLPPRTRSSTRLVRMFVARQEDSIGYIPEDELQDGVKVVYRFRVPD